MILPPISTPIFVSSPSSCEPVAEVTAPAAAPAKPPIAPVTAPIRIESPQESKISPALFPCTTPDTTVTAAPVAAAIAAPFAATRNSGAAAPPVKTESAASPAMTTMPTTILTIAFQCLTMKFLVAVHAFFAQSTTQSTAFLNAPAIAFPAFLNASLMRCHTDFFFGGGGGIAHGFAS